MYFHTDNPLTVWRLHKVLSDADERGRRVRFRTDDKGRLHFKIGEGMWEILEGTPDPYRDNG